MKAANQSMEDRIRSIVRADYDEITDPSLPERHLWEANAFFQITELARFWDAPQTGGESLAERQQRLITSLYGTRIPWTYTVLGEGGVASVFMGLPCPKGESRSWPQSLAAQFPGSSWRMERPAQKVLATLVGFPVVAAISGNPSIGGTGDQKTGSGSGPRSSGLESLFETMAGARWAYMMLALPLTEQELTRELRGIEAEMLETNSAYLRRGSAEENNNPLATRYASLLKSAHQKLLQGRKQGMWWVQSYLMTDTVGDCERGAQALHAAFGGPDSDPQPLRIKVGTRNATRSGCDRMITRLNTAEVAAMASLPQREVAGLQVIDYVALGMG
ncbi:MAG: hypothetical protein WCI73_07885, partial [Phycisphaerae bacterium]